MKKAIYLLCISLSLGLLPVYGQRPPVNPMTGTPNPPAIDPATGLPVNNLIEFDLDFPGGTPSELVRAIEKATGKPLNAIIPTDDADTQLPPLKMNNVVVPRLFAALEAASQRTIEVSIGGFGNAYTQNQVGYGFRTSDNPVTDNSIWNFYFNKPTMPPVVSTEPVCHFFQLQSYLNSGFTVDDITTAIRTGWKMAGVTSPPDLNYHKETKLLIAFGKPDELQTIQNVLDALPQTKADQNQASNQIDQTFKLMRLEAQVKQLSEQVTFLTTNSFEKIKPAR
jgi:hypothetical protein